ncbi:MAG TPA: alpha/beta hydrolase [Hyphomonadaceae bacterium]|jgi:pimeloyl-ACP methyl ester carboxylesterase
MLRVAFAGISILALSLGACATMTPAATETAAPAQPAVAAAAAPAAKPAPALEDKYATSADGTKIHYVASGQGPLVVMIHGFPDYWGSWSKLIPTLNDSYRTIAIDTRGYNLSDKPQGVANYAMPKLVEDIDAVIQAEGRQKATVVGHDWGAAIAWNYAFAHMDKLDNLIIMSVPHPANFGRQLTNSPQNSDYARNFQKEGSEKNLTAEGLAGWVQDPEMKPKYVEAFKKSDFAAMMNYYRANYPVGDNAPSTLLPPNFPKIAVPLLVIHGMKDQALLSAGHNDTWDQAAKDTTVLMIPTANHFVQHDAAPLVNKTIRTWLDARRPS